jgi:hypothetical protein
MTVQQRAEDYKVEWVELTPDQWVEAKRQALEDLGMTWDELSELIHGGRYVPYEARQVWMIIGEPSE